MRAFYAVFLPVCGLICAQGQGKNWLMGRWKIKFREPMPVRAQARMAQWAFARMASIYRPDALPCASANGSGRYTVSPTVPNAYELFPYRGFWCACIRLPRTRLWRVCALPQTQPLYVLSALTVVCVSLFRNAGARARVRIYIVSVFRYICAQTQGGWSS